MSPYTLVALLLALLGPLLALAARARAPASLALFGAGVGAAFVPGLPPVRIDPDLVLTLLLPPLLYASTVRVSWHLLRFTLLPGVVLGALLVLATVAAVAVAAHEILLPGLSWPAAILLGTLASVFDTRLFHEAAGRPRVPRAVSDTLKARELVGRVVILAVFGLTVETVEEGRPSLLTVLEHVAFDIPAGIAAGFAVGHAVVWARRRIDPAPIEIAVSLAAPYVAALAATGLGLSVVATITTTALVIAAVRIDRRTGATMSSAEARVSATAFWEEASLLVSSVLFFLAGRALPEALGALEAWPAWLLAAGAAGTLLVVLAVQGAFAWLATRTRPLAAALRGRSRAAAAAVMAWSSTRSVIGLVIALSIPATLPDGSPFPDRDVILVLAALTIVTSVLVQGLTLRRVVEGAGLRDEGAGDREEALARETMQAAAAAPERRHAHGFDAAREALVRLRERDAIGDETLAAMLRETDLTARAAEGDALPGAGPPNP